ncbi:lantibiotic immunity ABC transporter MutE/EpiE family permease subunit [Lysinibacillus agricola]|uniref:Lantibiotic immunity ABC transporter MutE/EpiE family permease subunit n=1 Tax=Lysinibacillus agricola TaxID=2590012 RepID=A0ABX7AWP6_9BACI|nr:MULTISPECIES: lantibiotic immunity ABC transporter MutE/EpiE family permease subunit [Lysinibacillus]KOS62741.1 lantibiotic ABC transporter permease [Lysinibacillus sp. FJAT-14222]QQP13712.1 lantibiotic immunity ABC transporter MutE/EpiE family permease subunit [Lysinibacillus agricola]
MISIMKAERLKWKKTFIIKLVWLAPIVAILLTAVLMGGKFFQSGAYNFWYTMLLPGALTICCALAVEKDAKLKYHSILAMPIDLKKIWFGKILACSAWLLVTTLIFFVSITASGILFGTSYSLTSSLTGSSLIFLTLLWQIPFCLFLATKLGTYMAILINLVGNIFGVVAFADGEFWYSVPYAITARLICPTLGILPNGLLVPEGSPLLSMSVIVPGLLIALAWFALISYFTARWFQKREAK